MALTVGSQSNQLSLLTIINRLNNDHALSMARLATGLRITRAADDPAGTIAVSQFDQELASTDAALASANRADAMLNTADGSITQISSLLTDIAGLVAQSANSTGISDAERAANQLQIDTAIEAIDRIVQTTEFNGARLLDGTQAIQAAASDATKIRDIRVYARPSGASTATLSVNVVSAATTAAASFVDMSGSNATLSAETTLTISGKLGTTTVTIATGASRSTVMSAINDATFLTGVTATTSGSTGIRLESQDRGEAAFVSVSVLSGDADFVSGGNVAKTTGTDAVVTINGQSASVDGANVNYVRNGYALSFTLADNTTGSRTISISGGGATFQLGTNTNSRATIGIANLATAALGEAGIGYLRELKSGGSADLASDATTAGTIVQKAILQVAQAGARVGGFQKYAVQSTINTLSSAKENITAARSSIRDLDYASELANLNRTDMLSEMATALLGVSNSQVSNIVGLLR